MDTDTIVRIGLIALVAIAVLTAMPRLRGTSSKRTATGKGAGSTPVRREPYGTGDAPADANPVGHPTGPDGGRGS
ncbi:hypothetical protein [Pseudonocardia xinjiangensis]|uniref:Uncharacterized protein n=1 Tax=Pseudonocardia xinjiangensis TaxID=75289 RepID=A0ABX1RNE5_9PSEU|nr:hypothetical protein [Pseudonocardia xinjiangensis]NMH81399.1 hypothetical protein [Pseudonocardia xinjiangensis]